MIPDNASYFEALYWYVTMKLLYPKKLKDRLVRMIIMILETVGISIENKHMQKQ